MSYKAAVCGAANTGKSYARRTIHDGENVFILQPSMKAPHLFTGPPENRVPRGTFGINAQGNTLQMAMQKLSAPSIHHLIKYYNDEKPAGFLKKEYVTGNIQLVKEIYNVPIWCQFVHKHMPWIHTLIIADFTHYISNVISRPDFINRKSGGEAYQRFWELAGDALNTFISDLDSYREDLVILNEYHADYSEILNSWQFYTPAGKMLTEKFKPETYYDVLLFTDANIKEDLDGNVTSKEYSFITERTGRYPLARAMNMFNTTKIANDLQLVLDKMRAYIGIPLPQSK